jgi:hypothetical protein
MNRKSSGLVASSANAVAMNILQMFLIASLFVLCALSCKSLFTLGRASAWTSIGWLASLLYGGVAAYEIGTRHEFQPFIPYGLLAVMTLAFVIAGVRDEVQAEPWYWPSGTGKTRAERRVYPPAG